MSAGGYIFRKVDLTYDPNTNGATVLDWAKQFMKHDVKHSLMQQKHIILLLVSLMGGIH